MNRIQPRPPSSKLWSPGSNPQSSGKQSAAGSNQSAASHAGNSSASIVEAGRFQAVAGQGPYALFAPLHYEPNYAYPLVIWLHGPEDNESQLQRIMPQVSLRNYVALAPRGTAAASGERPAAFEWRQTEEHILAAEQRVLDCVDVASEKFHIAASRVFLAGYDCGGTMAFRVAMRNPQRFAGVLSFGGPLPTGHAPMAQLDAIRRLSVFVGCNRTAVRYPTDAVCDDLRLLHAAGMSIVLMEFPGDDGLTPQMLSQMDRWLMDQVTTSDVARASSP